MMQNFGKVLLFRGTISIYVFLGLLMTILQLNLKNSKWRIQYHGQNFEKIPSSLYL